MRIRAIVLALALASSLTVAAEAKTYKAPKVHKVSVKRSRGAKVSKASKIKPRKAKRIKSHTRKG